MEIRVLIVEWSDRGEEEQSLFSGRILSIPYIICYESDEEHIKLNSIFRKY